MTHDEALDALKQEPTAISLLHDEIAALPRSWKNLDMAKVLIPAVKALPDLLSDKRLWQSKYIDYEQPYLMRLYHQIDQPSKEDPSKINKARLNVHYFFAETDQIIDPYSDLENPYALHAGAPRKTDEAQLYHYHSWAAGFFLFEGGYSQEIGYADTFGPQARPPVTECRTHEATDAVTRAFAFNSPYLWHRVIPQGTKPVCTLMVSYAPDDWVQKDPPPPALRDLETHEKEFMLWKFKQLANNANSTLSPL